jgi:hypothetical protein
MAGLALKSPKYSFVYAKLFVASGLLLTSIFSFILLDAHIHRWPVSGSVVNWIEHNRSTIGIIVQVLSHLLAVIQLYALCTPFRAWCRV